jgi:IS5 family transposase
VIEDHTEALANKGNGQKLMPLERMPWIYFMKQWYFGMKAHAGTDTRRGSVYSIVVTNAAVHDYHILRPLI